MEFLVWHYTGGLTFYINSWLAEVDSVNHYFSPVLLLRTLFSPWKRLIIATDTPGFNLSKFFEVVTYNLISRVIGAIVRFILFWIWAIVLVFVVVFGTLGVFFWIALPPLGLLAYLEQKKKPTRELASMIDKIQRQPGNRMQVFFESEPGTFIKNRLEMTTEELVKNATGEEKMPTDLEARSLEEFVGQLLTNKPWNEDFFSSKGLASSDMLLAAKWWDKRAGDEYEKKYGRGKKSGIARELVSGYTPNLNRCATDMSSQAFAHHLIGRQQVVSRMERTLSGGSSILLMAAPGVGKKTVVYEFAHRAVDRKVLEFDYSFLLSGATDLDQKKTSLSQILAEASAAGNVILVIRDIHKLTNPEVEGNDFTDIFERYLEKGDLKIIAISTPVDYERFVSKNMRLRKFLEVVEVVPPTIDEAMVILMEASTRWERLRKVTVSVSALKAVLEGSDQYVTDTPFPEKALELLDAVVLYREQAGGGMVTRQDVATILSEKTGISFATLTKQEKKKLGNLEEIIHERLVNQDVAVDLIGKSLRSRLVGVSKENRPVGSFLFLGPTGVGKTETAKVLAKVYYGSEEEILRFDMAEYAGNEGLERLIGSRDTNQPGVLTTAIKNRPASLLLLDEIEKAPREIYNLFLTLLDEGMLTDVDGRKIIGRHLFIIATSNASAEYIRQLVSKGVAGEELQKLVINKVLEDGIFSPEFLNRFDGVVVYEPLKNEDLVKVAGHLLDDLAVNLKGKNIKLEVAPSAAQKLASEGFDPAFGARPMRRIIDLVIGDVIGKAILTGEIKEGDNIVLEAGPKKDEYLLERLP